MFNRYNLKREKSKSGALLFTIINVTMLTLNANFLARRTDLKVNF